MLSNNEIISLNLLSFVQSGIQMSGCFYNLLLLIGHPSKYGVDLLLLNFGDLVRTGALALLDLSQVMHPLIYKVLLRYGTQAIACLQYLL